ncbi:13202_t:CDS:1 [Cetraspora pellucida]|uniref:13202_t:CDS:1 n=1 Tax=Cetraspora pellucida TaxID=1433469 RepID=A0A9N9HVN8_9GLOM|nr:13202_t:CDS:1 [Cetraspora pellucida]
MSTSQTLNATIDRHEDHAWISVFSKLFDSEYTTLHQLAGWFDIEDSAIWEKYILDIVQGYVKEGSSIFEAGCGCGAVLNPIQKNFKNITIGGVDGSERAIQHLLQHVAINTKKENFLVGFIPDELLTIKSEQYDVTISHSVFQYMSKENALLSVDEMLRITKPGGVVIIGDICDEEYKEETEAIMKQHWGEDYQSKLPTYLYLPKSLWKRYENKCKVLVRNSLVEEYWRRESRYIVYLRKRNQD